MEQSKRVMGGDRCLFETLTNRLGFPSSWSTNSSVNICKSYLDH